MALVTVLAVGKWRGVKLAQHRASVAASAAALRVTDDAGSSTSTSTSAATGIGAGTPPHRELPPPTAFHGGSSHTNRAAGTGPLEPHLVWSVPVAGAVQAQPVASHDSNHLYISTLTGLLLSLARTDGRIEWKFALAGRAYTTPLVADDGTIYAGSDGHAVFAVAPNGTQRWKLDVPGEVDTAFVALTDGDIAFAAGREVYALHSNGVVAWRFVAGGKVFTAPALASGRVVFGAQDNHAYGVGPDGTLAWSVDLGADVDGSPAVTDDGAAVFGTDEGAVVCIGANGKIAWKTPMAGFVRGGVSIARNGDVLVGMYGPTPGVVRLGGKDGHILGTFAVDGTGAKEFGVHGGPLEDDRGALFFGAQDDRVYAVGPDGVRMWAVERGGDVDAPLTLLPPGDLVVGSDDGSVALYR